MERRDPVEARASGDEDLYDVATWEPRTWLDRLAVSVYNGVLTVARAIIITLALLILLTQFLLGGIGAVFMHDPTTVTLVVLSVVPALGIAAYVYVTDITTSEPLDLLVGTFVLGVLFAGFAAIINSVFSPLFEGLPGIFGLFGLIGFFYLVVGPVEETVKWLGVRLYAYRDDRFNAVIDGAVYGAAAGLGFATIENALYITRTFGENGSAALVGAAVGAAPGPLSAAVGSIVTGGALGVYQIAGLNQIVGLIETGGRITALRALAGPGHVIYSAFAGYYLGLAKFNRSRAGPIAVKGLLIAAFIHGSYNVLVSIVPTIVTALVPGVSELVVFFGFVVVYDGLFGYVLVRKLRNYRRAYRAVHDHEDRTGEDVGRRLPEKTEFE